MFLTALRPALHAWLASPALAPPGIPRAIEAFNGAGGAAANFLLVVTTSVLNPVSLLFIFLILRALLWRQWAAVSLFLLIAAVLPPLQGGDAWFEILYGAGLWAVTLVVLLRVGLLAAMAMELWRQVIIFVPMTFRLSAWYADRGWLALLLLAALLGWAYRIAVAGHPPFPGTRLAPQNQQS